jgi:hypothetical protein
MTILDDLGTLVKAHISGKPQKFRPCAYFDDRLDCIRVLARDCSILETRINKVLTVLEDNYYQDTAKRYVGFTVKGARHFCHEHGLDTSMPIDISKLLDAILATFPEPEVQMFVDLFARPLVKKEKLKKVDVPPSTTQPVFQT